MKCSRWVSAGIVLVALAGAFPSGAVAERGSETMFVVPARYGVIQVMMDVLRHRDITLISFQGEPTSDDPLLHVWNGREWTYLSTDDYRAAHFGRSRPVRVVLVGDRTILPVTLASSASEWAESVLNVDQMDPASLVNASGRVLSFTKSEWKWFARRYAMNLDDARAEQRSRSWYNEPYVEQSEPESPWQIFRRKFFPRKEKTDPAPVRTVRSPAPGPRPTDADTDAPAPLPPPPSIPMGGAGSQQDKGIK
ncbi:MAG: hypothetical protein U1E27_10350 [Kiritimatiellia bacterium]|nr:hypothetical protein [Kiritimatiellia bacterium]